MPVGLGNKAYMQVGVESVYGTAVAASTYKLEVISANIDPQVGTILDPSLYSGQSRRSIFQGGLFYQGRIVVRANFLGLGRLIRAAFGAVVTTGAGPFTHTYKEAATPPSLTIELSEGDIPAGLVKRAIGCIVTDMVVRGTAGQGEGAMLTIEFGIVAKTVTLSFTPTGALVFPAIGPWLFHQSTSATVDGSGDTQANQRVRSFEIALANNYALDRFYFGSLNPDQPVRNDFLSARWTITSEFQNINAITRATAFTTTAPKLVITAGADSIEFRSNSAKLTSYGNPVEGYGILLMNMVHEAFNDPGDASALVCVLTNGDNAAANET